MTDQKLTSSQVEEHGLADWRILFSTLHARFTTGDFATGLALANRIGAAAEEMDHHPDLVLTYPLLDVRLTSHDVGGVTDRDITLARRISGFAAELGVGADPGAVSVLELGLDTWDAAAIRPFWAAVLGAGADGDRDDEVTDPTGVLPSIWFQETEEHEEPRQRFHLDIRVPPEVATARVEAALAAGGVLVTEEFQPAFTVLADVQGNKVCVCTCEGRD